MPRRYSRGKKKNQQDRPGIDVNDAAELLGVDGRQSVLRLRKRGVLKLIVDETGNEMRGSPGNRTGSRYEFESVLREARARAAYHKMRYEGIKNAIQRHGGSLEEDTSTPPGSEDMEDPQLCLF